MAAPTIVGFSNLLSQVSAEPPAPGADPVYRRTPFPDPAHPEQFDLDTIARAVLVVIDFREHLDRATLVHDLLVLGNPAPAPPCLLVASPATVHWVERCISRPDDWVLPVAPEQRHLTVSLPGPAGRERRKHPRRSWPDIDLYLGEYSDDGPAIETARGIDASPTAILLDARLRYHAGQGVCVRLKGDEFWAVGAGVIARSSRSGDGWNRYLVANLKIHDGDSDWFTRISD